MEGAQSFTLQQIARAVGGHILDDRHAVITGVAGIESAGPGDVTFFEEASYLPLVKASTAGAVLVREPVAGARAAQIKVEGRPYLKFIDLVSMFHPVSSPQSGVDRTAVVDPEAHLHGDAIVGPLVVVERGAHIGARTVLHAGSYVGPGAQIGEDCRLFPRAVVREGCRLGNRILVHSGAVLGDDGFGYVRDADRHVKIPHIGLLIVEDDVEIGANTTIDRSTFGETRIGAGTKIDNLVMIAHNVRIGKRCILAGQVGIAGSTEVGDDSILAGQVGIARGAKIGRGVIAASKSGISSKVRDGEIVAGIPANRHSLWKRAAAAYWRLPEILARLRVVEQKLGVERAKKSRP